MADRRPILTDGVAGRLQPSAGGSVLRLLSPLLLYRTPYRRRRSALEKQLHSLTIPTAESPSVTRAVPYILPWDGGWGRTVTMPC